MYNLFMNDVIYFLFNLTIFVRYLTLLPCWGITRSAEIYVFAFFLTIAQIIGTLLFLGAVGWLYPVAAILLNGIILLIVTAFPRQASSEMIRGGVWKEILRPPSNKIMLGAALIVVGWLLLCAYFLPPRGLDDIVCYLPFIYESIQRGEWTILPIELRNHFAYPMNVEVLYSWSVLFLGDTRWVDASQIPIGIWTSGILYLFARHFGLRRVKAFFLSILFLLTPIVIAQMGTNYNDLCCTGFLLSSLYLTTRFLLTAKNIYVRLAFLSIGIMMGMKFHLLFCGSILSLILILKLISTRNWKDIFFGFMAISGLGIGWYLRNSLVFSDFLYPLREVSSHVIGQQTFKEMILAIPFKVELIFFGLINNGTVAGGLGRYYGYVIFISGIFMGWIFLLRKHRWKKGEVLLCLIALFFVLIIIPEREEEFPWLGSRILLVVWPIFLLMFGRMLFVLNKKAWIHKLLIAIYFLGFSQDAVVCAQSPMPHHRWYVKSIQSEFESYRYSSWYIGRLGPTTSTLDAMTQSLSRRATIYLVAPSNQFFSAPFYGQYLQTKIINFDKEFQGDPDFLVYLTISPEPLTYIGKYRKTLSEAAASEYKEVFSSPNGRIFAHPRLLK